MTGALALLVVALGATLARADVATSFDGSHLVVTGDGSPDDVSIDGGPDGIAVTGLDGTLVDGSSRPVIVSGVQRLTVKLKGGSDRLTIQHLTIPHRLDVRVGGGNDGVELDDVRAGATRISTENGSDWVNVLDSSRLKSLTV